MDEMTAEQAAEAAKGLTFEKVWAVVIQTQKMIQDTQAAQQASLQAAQQETQKRMEETQKRMEETEKQIQESRKQMQESRKQMQESQKKTDKIIADLSKNIGGLGNSLGRFTEAMFSTELWKKFNELGYSFTRQAPRMKFIEYGQVLAEVDFFLENGDYAMLVEIKTELSLDDVVEHLERIEKIRQYLDNHHDRQKLVGAVAGGIVSEGVLKYAQRKGLFVIEQSGDSVALAAMPPGFKAREWYDCLS